MANPLYDELPDKTNETIGPVVFMANLTFYSEPPKSYIGYNKLFIQSSTNVKLYPNGYEQCQISQNV